MKSAALLGVALITALALTACSAQSKGTPTPETPLAASSQQTATAVDPNTPAPAPQVSNPPAPPAAPQPQPSAAATPTPSPEPPRQAPRADVPSRGGSVSELRPLTSGRPTLRQGDSGTAVEALQSRLQVKHSYPVSITGTFDANTLTYVKEFQAHMGLTADGVVGPATWEALISHFQELEWSGPGFYRYTTLTTDESWGTEKTISLIHQVTAQWAQRGHGVCVGINDISRPHGGAFSPHSSHRSGREVDFRVFRSDGVEDGVTWQDAAYSRALTQELVDLIYATGDVEVILFNDPNVRGVKPWDGHDDHLHVRFRP